LAGLILVDVCMSHFSGVDRIGECVTGYVTCGANWYRLFMSQSVTLARTDNELPVEGATTPKHIGAILMYILILFLRQ